MTPYRQATAAEVVATGALWPEDRELRDFLDNAVDGMHWIGPDGTILWANTAELSLLGYSPDEYIGRNIAEFHVDRDVIADILQRLHRNETIRNAEARMRCRDGSIRDVQINSSVYRRDGEFIHTRCVTRDITQQKRIARERERALRHLAAEHAVTKILAEPKPFREVVPRLLETIGDAGGWHLGALWMRDDLHDVLRCAAFWRSPAADGAEFEAVTRATAFQKGTGLPGRIWSSETPNWIPDVAEDANFPRAALARKAGLHAAVGFPIGVRGRVAAVLEYFGLDVRHADADLLQLFDTLGVQIGHFIDRRQNEEMRDRLAAIVDSSDDAIASKTLDGVITSWNRGAQDMFGYTAEEAVGRHISLIIPTDRLSEEDEVLARLRRGEKIDHYETVRQTKAGRLLNISLTVSPIRNADGDIVGASKVARDITIQKRAEEAMRQQVEDRERAVRARDDFLSIASHELRNPLNALQLQLVGLQRTAEEAAGPLPRAWLQERLSQATNDVGNLVRLVHNLLDVARISAGCLDIEPEDIEFAKVVRMVVSRFRQQLGEGQAALDLDPVCGRCDRLRFEQIVTNLVSNAIKYGRGRPIEIALRASGDNVRLTVKDDGIGIAPEDQNKLFGRFARAVSRRAYGGFGLGLWIAHETVRAMHGQISVESRPGEGSTFSVTLPRIAAEPAAL